MSVLIDTTLGSFQVDLYTTSAPVASRNFLKLCKLKYYHGCLFFNVQAGYVAQTGDPTGTGRGGASIFALLHGEAAAAGFENEFRPHLRHNKRGTLSMVPHHSSGGNGSQFLITLRDACPALDDHHTIFGSVVLLPPTAAGGGGGDTTATATATTCTPTWPTALSALDASLVDTDGRPFVDARITHTHVLVDPFEDPRGLIIPPCSPKHIRPPTETVTTRLGAAEADAIAAEATLVASGYLPTAQETALRRETRAAQEAASSAVLLEMTGDLPSADAKPPESALFVCKLNPVTAASDLDLIFSRFGEISQCDILKDAKTGASLCYGFVVFIERAAAEAAYLKMDNVLIDDRRIRVDFSQSVAGSRAWNAFTKRKVGGGGGGGEGGGGGGGGGAGVKRVLPSGNGSSSAGSGGASGKDVLSNIFAQINARTALVQPPQLPTVQINALIPPHSMMGPVVPAPVPAADATTATISDRHRTTTSATVSSSYQDKDRVREGHGTHYESRDREELGTHHERRDREGHHERRDREGHHERRDREGHHERRDRERERTTTTYDREPHETRGLRDSHHHHDDRYRESERRLQRRSRSRERENPVTSRQERDVNHSRDEPERSRRHHHRSRSRDERSRQR